MKDLKQLDAICLDAYTKEDVEAFREAMLGNAAAVFVYNKNAYSGGMTEQIDKDNYKVRPEYRCGTLLAPVLVFLRIKGATVTENSITLGTKTLTFEAGSTAYKLDGKAAEFTTAPFKKFGHTFVPVLDTAEVLGLSSRTLYQNRLVVFGEKGVIEKLDAAIAANPAVEFAGGGAVIGEYDATKFTSADFKMAKDKWRLSLAASPELLDLSDPTLAEKIATISNKAKELWQTMNRGERIILWGDTPPVESCDLRFQYDKLYSLTLGWAVYGSELYHNEELKKDILEALLWMYEHMYGEAELEDRGWRSIHLFNWWDWYVGAIEPLTDTMLLMEEFLTMEEKKKYLKVLEFVLDSWRTGDTQPCCSGRMSVGTKCALLLEDPVRLNRSANDYHVMLEVKAFGDGTLTDYVNYQHGFPYNLMYGMSNLNRVLKVGANLAGTPLEFSSPRYYNQFNLFKYMYEAAMYRGRGFMVFYGRASASTEYDAAGGVLRQILPMIGNYGDEEDAYIRHFVKYSIAAPDALLRAKGCTLGNYPMLKSILDDDTIPSENTYECAHAWYTADRATQHRNDYAFLVSMPSYRHPNYECINNANKTGWYMNDGTLYLYTKTDQHEFDGVNFVLNRRLAHRMPGTTVDSRERKAVSITIGNSFRPTSDKVGCMQFDGKYVTAGMDYEAYNQPEDEIKEDKGYGGGKPKFPNDLVAKKAYFMFDDECVCLGAGITSTMDSDVNTVVEHRRLVKLDTVPTGADTITVDGVRMDDDTFERTFEKPGYARLEDIAGYVFLDAERVSVAKYMYELDPETLDPVYISSIPEYAKGSRPFVEIMINHGKNPKNGSYAYVVLPYADEEKLSRYAKDPDVEIISNTTLCQAVKEKNTGVTGIVFYEAGECAGIAVDRACIVTFSECDGELKISACEPTYKADSITLTVKKRLTPVCVDRHMSVECGGEATVITVDTELSVGEAYAATFKL